MHPNSIAAHSLGTRHMLHQGSERAHRDTNRPFQYRLRAPTSVLETLTACSCFAIRFRLVTPPWQDSRHMSRVHFIGGEKGGVGKSVVSRVLSQYFIDHEIPSSGSTPTARTARCCGSTPISPHRW